MYIEKKRNYLKRLTVKFSSILETTIKYYNRIP